MTVIVRLLRRRSAVRQPMPLLGIGLIAATIAGCHYPPPRVPVPGPENRDAVIERDPVKPLPSATPTGGFDDPPLVTQRPPEQRAFVDAYNRVGRPRIAVF